MINNSKVHKASGNLISRLLLMLAFTLAGQMLFAQSKQITGVVKDVTGETVIVPLVVPFSTTLVL